MVSHNFLKKHLLKKIVFDIKKNKQYVLINNCYRQFILKC